MTFDANPDPSPSAPPDDFITKTLDNEKLQELFGHLDLPPDVQEALLNLPQADRKALLNSPELRELPGKLDAALDRIAQLSNEELEKIDASSYGLPPSLNSVVNAAKQSRQSELTISQLEGAAVGLEAISNSSFFTLQSSTEASQNIVINPTTQAVLGKDNSSAASPSITFSTSLSPEVQRLALSAVSPSLGGDYKAANSNVKDVTLASLCTLSPQAATTPEQISLALVTKQERNAAEGVIPNFG